MDVFNNFDSHLQFTVETESNSSVPFLDTIVIRNLDQTISLNWYTKPTYSGRYINFHSNHPLNQKLNTVVAMVNRVRSISDVRFLDSNLKKLRDIFVNNGYPIGLVNRILYHNGTYHRNISQPSEGDDQHDISSLPGPRTHFVKIPFVPRLTDKLVSVLRCDSVRFAKCNSLPLSTCFSRTKDLVPKGLQSNVIYRVPCNNCEKTYIGTTSQYFDARIKQHKRDCQSRDENKSALVHHHVLSGHHFNFENSQIVDKESIYSKRLFLEMFYINKEVNSLNFRTDTQNLSSIYSYLVMKDWGRRDQTSIEGDSLVF
nr:uncharacterized protein LOC111422201 [Onthophagus taurus]